MEKLYFVIQQALSRHKNISHAHNTIKFLLNPNFDLYQQVNREKGIINQRSDLFVRLTKVTGCLFVYLSLCMSIQKVSIDHLGTHL